MKFISVTGISSNLHLFLKILLFHDSFLVGGVHDCCMACNSQRHLYAIEKTKTCHRLYLQKDVNAYLSLLH